MTYYFDCFQRAVDYIETHLKQRHGILGDVVTNVNNIPPGFTSFEIPATTYAVFPIRPRNKFAWGLTISKTKEYAYNKWLPNSKYEQAGFDFEYHDERSVGKKPEIDLYIAVKEKN